MLDCCLGLTHPPNGYYRLLKEYSRTLPVDTMKAYGEVQIELHVLTTPSQYPIIMLHNMLVSYTIIGDFITSLGLWEWNNIVTHESILTFVHISINNLCKKSRVACYEDCCRVLNSRIRNTYGQSTEIVVREN